MEEEESNWLIISKEGYKQMKEEAYYRATLVWVPALVKENSNINLCVCVIEY